MVHDYLNLEIRIGTHTSDGYPVSVRGPGGDASGMLLLPIDLPVYQRAIAQLAALATDEDSLIQLGQLLFAVLFTPPVKEVLVRSQGKLKTDQGLRLIFDIDAHEAAVAAVPWEFLVDPDQGPLALRYAPMVRYLPSQAAVPTLAAPLPLKVLLTSADTPPQVQVERELRDIQQALERLGEQIAITVEPHLTGNILQRRLREDFHVWHFVGHGGIGADGTTGIVQFEDETGGIERVSAHELNILLNGRGVRLVILNACQTAALRIDPLRSIAPALIRADVPAVIAMQSSVSAEGARAFAGQFYQALAEGYPIDVCVTEGRRAVRVATGPGRPDWGIPVVYTRAADGRLFAPTPLRAPDSATARRPINDGLVALHTLMETPAIYAAVASGRDQFQEVRRQIDTLGRYKKLHDQLQHLDDRARIVDGDRHRLPQDPHARGNLARSEEDLHATITGVLELAGTEPADALWARKLERAQHELRIGVEQGNLELLSSALNRIDDILGSVPWNINTRLVAVAASLSLRAMTQNLSMVAAQLSNLLLDQWEARQYDVFVQGVAALETLDAHMSQLVRRHNLFQVLENELRQIEIGIDIDVRGLADAWPDLQPLHQQVCEDLAVAWAPRLIATVTELEQSLEAPTGQRTTMIFSRYRGQVNQSFNQVDADLLKLCDELQGIRKSLDFVLRTVP